MSQNYDIDDILEEVRRKKAVQSDNHSKYEPPRSASPSQERTNTERNNTQRRVAPSDAISSGNYRPRQESPMRDVPRSHSTRPQRETPLETPLQNISKQQRSPPARQARPEKEQNPPRRVVAPESGSGWTTKLPRMTPRKKILQEPAQSLESDYNAQPYEPPPPQRRQVAKRNPFPEQATRQVQGDDYYRPRQHTYPPEQVARPRGGNVRDASDDYAREQRDDYGRDSRDDYARGQRDDYSPDSRGDYAREPRDDYRSPQREEYNSRYDEAEQGAEFHDTQAQDFSVHIDLDAGDTGELYESDQSQFGGHTGTDLIKSRWHQSFVEQERMEQPLPDDDFGTPEDAPYVAQDLKKLRVGLLVRTISMVIITIVTAYFTLSIKYPPFAALLGEAYEDPRARLPLPTVWIYPDDHPRIFLSVMLVLCVIGAIVCSNIVAAGFGALFRFRANSDTPAALCVLAVLVQNVVLIMYPTQLEAESVSVYVPLAMLVMLFTLIGKMMLAKRITRNFQFLIDEKEKYTMISVVNREFARELSRGLGPEVDQVAYCAGADFITGFLSKSYTGDYSDNFYCVSAPISFLGSLLVGALAYILSKNPVLAVSAFAGTMCICAPLSSAIVPHLMLGRMSKWLCKRGAMLAGYETAEEISAVGAVMIDEKEIFPGDCVQLHGMKVFAEKRVDEAIMDAASVILSCNGLLSGVFLNMVGGNQRLLKKVDSMIYEEGMGISAWVDGKRVLIGNRELMRTHEVECPSRDFEVRYTKGGRRVLYISNSGELSAMFVVSYNGDTRTAERLADLERRGMAMILYTTDPNVTNELVAATFGIRKGTLRVLPAKLHVEYSYLTRVRDRVTAGSVHQGGMAGILQLLKASASVCHSVRTGAVAQLIGIVTGYGVMVALVFTKSMTLASFHNIALYGLVTLAVTTFVSNFGKT